MYDDLHAYFIENVVRKFERFVESRESEEVGESSHLRCGVDAAAALYHFREFLPDATRPLVEDVTRSCPEYDLLRDVTDVSKHGSLNRPSARLKKAEDLVEQTVFTRIKDDSEPGAVFHKRVLGTLEDGTTVELYPALVAVLNYWSRELERRGVIKKATTWKVKPPPIPTCDAVKHGPSLRMIRGVRFSQNWLLQEYDPETGVTAPMDLTDSEMKLRLYRPSIEVEVTLRNDLSGVEFTETVALSQEDAAEFERLRRAGDEPGLEALAQESDELRRAMERLIEKAGESDT